MAKGKKSLNAAPEVVSPEPEVISPEIDPRDRVIEVPTRDIEAIVNATLGGDKVAAVNVVNKIRQMAEEQNPDVFVK